MHLLLFYLHYTPPVCLVCCIPRVQTIFATFLSLVSPTYLRALPPILGQNLRGTACTVLPFTLRNPAAYLHGFRLQFGYSRFCKESTGLQRHETSNQKEKKEIQHPAPIPRLKTFAKKDAFEGTACKRIAK